MTLIGAGVICSLVEIASPERWIKYIKLFTGVIIAILIVSPVKRFDVSIFEDINLVSESISDAPLREKLKEELEKRISTDIDSRIKELWGVSSTSKIKVSVNAAGEIDGVEEVEVLTKANALQVKKFISDIYGISEERVKVNGR